MNADTDGEPVRRGLAKRIAELFHPGPLDWLLGLTPRRSRFQPGPHMHGLEEHDVRARSSRRTH